MWRTIHSITTHYIYAICWLLGYGALWGVSFSGDGNDPWWQQKVLVAISVMMVPWIWRLPPTFTFPSRLPRIRRGSSSTYRRRKTPPSETPILVQKQDHIIGNEPLTHMQMKLSTGIARAYMMKPYYVSYQITYISSQHNEPADVLFRRYRHGDKSCQYYYDKALAHLTSCHLESMQGFMSDRHTNMMIKQARDACRTLIMSLDPEHLDDEFPRLYQEIDTQAHSMATMLFPHIQALTTRILPSSRPDHYSLPESEILHWFHHLDQKITLSN